MVRQSVLHPRRTLEHTGAARGGAGVPRLPLDRDKPEAGNCAGIPPRRSARADERRREPRRPFPAQWRPPERPPWPRPSPPGHNGQPDRGMAARALIHSTNTKGADTDYVATDFEPLPRFHRVIRLGTRAAEP